MSKWLFVLYVKPFTAIIALRTPKVTLTNPGIRPATPKLIFGSNVTAFRKSHPRRIPGLT